MSPVPRRHQVQFRQPPPPRASGAKGGLGRRRQHPGLATRIRLFLSLSCHSRCSPVSRCSSSNWLHRSSSLRLPEADNFGSSFVARIGILQECSVLGHPLHSGCPQGLWSLLFGPALSGLHGPTSSALVFPDSGSALRNASLGVVWKCSTM